MSIKTQKIFEAEFLLEDMREIIRKTSPHSAFSKDDKIQFNEKLKKLSEIVEELRTNKYTELKIKYITNGIELRTREEDFINIHPIQAAGRLTLEARKALISYGDGYSTCDWCRKPFRLDKIHRPPIDEFHSELAEFVGMDQARVVPGARRGFQAVVSSLIEKGDSVLLSAISHYTEFLAVEDSGGTVKEIPLNEKNIVTADATVQKIEDVKKNTKKLPKLIMLDHFDYMFGNEHDVYGIAKVANEYDIPFLYNGAYTVGIMPVDGKKIGADFVVGSGHKSMASVAPSGVLATTDEWASKVFRTTQMVGDITGRKFGIKEVEMLGCTLMGGTLISMMASFPKVVERTKHWDDEVKKSNQFLDEFLAVEGSKVISEYPRKHTLTKVNTTESFDKIAKTHKRRGFFLSDELRKRGIVGEFAGSTRTWKLNTYGRTWDQIKYLGHAFIDIAEKYDVPVKANKQGQYSGDV
ncbi:MAG: O-phospho-L-seryl-tRNA:Cys-tRNA synthase [Methanosarcinales archaeon Met12]|nr:MAG: O-phospho-L-seryl-tRNA:Cys-tRNA synthase [Methanosarcinales archaeon Met12]